jgi:hypothetical protein
MKPGEFKSRFFDFWVPHSNALGLWGGNASFSPNHPLPEVWQNP